MGLPFLPTVKPRWTPARNLTKLYGSQWAWFRPSLSPLNIWQDSAGSTAVTAAAQSVGFSSDYGRGIEALPNAWSDGSATAYGEATKVSAGVYRIYSSAGSASGITQNYTFSAGKAVSVTFTVDSVTTPGIGIQVAVGGSAGVPQNTTAPGVKNCVVIADGAANIVIKRGAGATDIQVSNVSFREITNAYALQSTTANKPTYYTDARSVPVLRHDTTDQLTATFATTLGSAASVYYANQWGAQQLHGVNVGTSYALPGKPGAGTADVYEWILVPTRPDQKTESEIVKWLTKTAGL